MRWADLFADLEAQLDSEQATQQRAEVADRSRRELASIALLDRLSAHLNRTIQVGVGGSDRSAARSSTRPPSGYWSKRAQGARPWCPFGPVCGSRAWGERSRSRPSDQLPDA
jgi:hypothetical protein